MDAAAGEPSARAELIAAMRALGAARRATELSRRRSGEDSWQHRHRQELLERAGARAERANATWRCARHKSIHRARYNASRRMCELLALHYGAGTPRHMDALHRCMAQQKRLLECWPPA